MKSIADSILINIFSVRQHIKNIFRFRKLNPFVLDECRKLGISLPDIKVSAVPYFAQLAEDRVVLALIDAHSQRNSSVLSQAIYVEIGANHPVSTSSTYLLMRERGMSGILVEANERLLQTLHFARPKDRIVHAAVQTQDVEAVDFSVSNLSEVSSLDRNFVLAWSNGRVGERARITVPATRINRMLELAAGRDIAYLSIDVEGLDLDILKDIDFTRHRPWLVQAEPSDAFIPGNTKNMVDYMISVRYRLVARTDYNLIFEDMQDEIRNLKS